MDKDNIQELATETNETQEIQAVENTEPKVEKRKSADILRELSKELSINLFDEDGLDKLKAKITQEKADRDTYAKQLEDYKSLEAEYNLKAEMSNKKIQALSHGFKAEDLDEVLALVQVNTKEGVSFEDTLKYVKTKWYGNRLQPTELGLNFSDTNKVEHLSDEDRYIQSNPLYSEYAKRRRK